MEEGMLIRGVTNNVTRVQVQNSKNPFELTTHLRYC